MCFLVCKFSSHVFFLYFFLFFFFFSILFGFDWFLIWSIQRLFSHKSQKVLSGSLSCCLSEFRIESLARSLLIYKRNTNLKRKSIIIYRIYTIVWYIYTCGGALTWQPLCEIVMFLFLLLCVAHKMNFNLLRSNTDILYTYVYISISYGQYIARIIYMYICVAAVYLADGYRRAEIYSSAWTVRKWVRLYTLYDMKGLWNLLKFSSDRYRNEIEKLARSRDNFKTKYNIVLSRYLCIRKWFIISTVF